MSDLIDRQELLKAIDTWQKFGCDANARLVPIKDCYIPYVHYDDVVNAIKGMPSVTPTERTAHWTIGHDENGRDIIACGYCGRVVPDMEPYCMSCGRRMLKPEEK